jgi:hypothetical protein
MTIKRVQAQTVEPKPPPPPPPPPPPSPKAPEPTSVATPPDPNRADQRLQKFSDATPAPRPAPEPTRAPPAATPDARYENRGDTIAVARRDQPATDEAALQGPAAMAARREFNHAPLAPKNAITAYKDLQAGDFAGPDDMRLAQINRVAAAQNADAVARVGGEVRAAGLDNNASVYGRAKSPFSLYGKLQETPNMTVGDVKDLSGVRVDIDPTKPNFTEYSQARGAVEKGVGDLKLKADYIEKPNAWGYTGRQHYYAQGANGVNHEVQIGSRDLSGFIDQKLKTTGGDKISVHDTMGYKGKIHGANVPPALQAEYPKLMGDITDANRAGKVAQDVPELKGRLDNFANNVQESLPDKINTPKPSVSTAAKVGNVAAKGAGVLGAVGGAFQMKNGVDQINEGKVVEGTADVAGGAGNVVAGTAMVAGRVALGTTVGGAVAVVDGAKDMYVGIRDGNTEKTIVGAVKSGAGAAMIAGVATANPILIAGGAVAYAGAAIYENREAIGNAISSAWSWATS